MATRFRHAALVGKFNAEGIRGELESVAAFLVAKGLAVTLEEDTAAKTGIDAYPRLAAGALGAACDIAVVVGGDGTMLGIARQLARHDTPLVGINQGRLGFITDVALGEFETKLGAIVAGEYDEETRAMLEGGVERDGKTIFECVALNDVIVSRGATAGMVELRIEIDGEFVAQLRADGLIVARPPPTSYALAWAGPSCSGSPLGVLPIAPHDFSNRPIVVPDKGEGASRIVAGRDASVKFDMHRHPPRPLRPHLRAPPATASTSSRSAELLPTLRGSCWGGTVTMLIASPSGTSSSSTRSDRLRRRFSVLSGEPARAVAPRRRTPARAPVAASRGRARMPCTPEIAPNSTSPALPMARRCGLMPTRASRPAPAAGRSIRRERASLVTAAARTRSCARPPIIVDIPASTRGKSTRAPPCAPCSTACSGDTGRSRALATGRRVAALAPPENPAGSRRARRLVWQRR